MRQTVVAEMIRRALRDQYDAVLASRSLNAGLN